MLALVYVGLICFVIPALAQYTGTRRGAARGFKWIAIAGLMFLIAALFSTETLPLWFEYTSISLQLFKIFQIIGWVFFTAGSMFVTVEYLKK